MAEKNTEAITDEDLAYLNANLDIVDDYERINKAYFGQSHIPLIKITRSPSPNLDLVYVHIDDINDTDDALYSTYWKPMLEHVNEHAERASYVLK